MAEFELENLLPSLITGTLEIDGGAIEGESLLEVAENQIDFHSIGFVSKQQTSAQVGRGRTQGRAEVSPVTIRKFIDKSSPDIALACMKSTNFAEMVLTIWKASGDDMLDYVKIILSDVIVSRYEILGSRPNSQQIEEMVQLTFQLIEFNYTVQNEDYSAGDVMTVVFDAGKGAQA